MATQALVMKWLTRAWYNGEFSWEDERVLAAGYGTRVEPSRVPCPCTTGSSVEPRRLTSLRYADAFRREGPEASAARELFRRARASSAEGR